MGERPITSIVRPPVEIASEPCYSLLTPFPLRAKWLLLFPVQPSGLKVFALS